MHKCSHGCGYEHLKRGAVNLHERYHCPKLKNSPPAEVKKPSGSKVSGNQKKSAGGEDLKCDCAAGPTLVFMNKQDSRLAGAIAAGYKRICEECGDVFK